MSKFQILDGSLSADQKTWLAAWESWADREPSCHPEYLMLFDQPRQRPLCAHYSDNGGEVLFPFFLRDLTAESWCPSDLAVWDFASPYGYGGPFAWGDPSMVKFWDEFFCWAKSLPIVAGFFRRGLFPEQLLPLVECETISFDNIVRSLQSPMETIWMDYEHKVRKNVNKANRNGLVFSHVSSCDGLDAFLHVYGSTMERRNATSFFDFDKSFFETLLRADLGLAKLFQITNVNGDVISSEVVLLSKNHLYSFLGGTLPEALPLGSNDLLKHGIIEWGQSNGYSQFVLGGGFTPSDGIFRYKRAFSPGGVVPFTVGRWILDIQLYTALVNHRKDWEFLQGRAWEPSVGFFPAFRAPS